MNKPLTEKMINKMGLKDSDIHIAIKSAKRLLKMKLFRLQLKRGLMTSNLYLELKQMIDACFQIDDGKE